MKRWVCKTKMSYLWPQQRTGAHHINGMESACLQFGRQGKAVSGRLFLGKSFRGKNRKITFLNVTFLTSSYFFGTFYEKQDRKTCWSKKYFVKRVFSNSFCYLWRIHSFLLTLKLKLLIASHNFIILEIALFRALVTFWFFVFIKWSEYEPGVFRKNKLKNLFLWLLKFSVKRHSFIINFISFE